MTEYVKKSDVLELLSLPKDLIAEYVCDLKGLWIDDDEVEQTEPNSSEKPNNCEPQTVSLTSVHISGDIYHKVKDEPQLCDTCRYYNSNIPCGSTPSACKEADKFAEEFVDGLKKLKPKDEPSNSEKPNNCEDCIWSVCNYNKAFKDEPTISKMEQVDEPQTDCAWK